jgi:hypothetical protein
LVLLSKSLHEGPAVSSSYSDSGAHLWISDQPVDIKVTLNLDRVFLVIIGSCHGAGSWLPSS